MRQPTRFLMACLLTTATGCAGGLGPTRPPAPPVPRPTIGQGIRGAERVRLDQMHAMAVEDAAGRPQARPAKEVGVLVSPDRPR